MCQVKHHVRVKLFLNQQYVPGENLKEFKQLCSLELDWQEAFITKKASSDHHETVQENYTDTSVLSIFGFVWVWFFCVLVGGGFGFFL